MGSHLIVVLHTVGLVFQDIVTLRERGMTHSASARGRVTAEKTHVVGSKWFVFALYCFSSLET